MEGCLQSPRSEVAEGTGGEERGGGDDGKHVVHLGGHLQREARQRIAREEEEQGLRGGGGKPGAEGGAAGPLTR